MSFSVPALGITFFVLFSELITWLEIMAHDTLNNIAISISVSTPPCSFVSVDNLTISFSTNSFFFTFVILSSISSGLIKVNVTGMSYISLNFLLLEYFCPAFNISHLI
jgi:hypothetical protein